MDLLNDLKAGGYKVVFMKLRSQDDRLLRRGDDEASEGPCEQRPPVGSGFVQSHPAHQ
jgi:hypothetical protein